MEISLPASIEAFFALGNGDWSQPLESCFGPDAVVTDERNSHRGHDEIRAWLEHTQRSYAYRAEPLRAEHRGDRLRVAARVSGNFPGSPIELDYRFRLDGERIASLEIG